MKTDFKPVDLEYNSLPRKTRPRIAIIGCFCAVPQLAVVAIMVLTSSQHGTNHHAHWSAPLEYGGIPCIAGVILGFVALARGASLTGSAAVLLNLVGVILAYG